MHGALDEDLQNPDYDLDVNGTMLASAGYLAIVQPGNHRRMLVKASDATNTVRY